MGRNTGARPASRRAVISPPYFMNFLSATTAWRLAVLLSLALCGACRPLTDAWTTGWTESQANDRIMLVREEPRTLGYRRLVSQSGIYPDLDAFLHVRGLPDFLAESNASKRRLLILYYLDDRSAVACRANAPSTRAIEFAGPYPITDREYQTLSQLKKDSTQMTAKP